MQPLPESATDPATPASDGRAEVQIVQAARGGDELAKERVVAALAPLPAMLRGKNARLGHLLGAHELEDATQNALLAIWQKLEQFDGRSPLLHWAYGFGVVELRRLVERRGRRREQEPPTELAATPAEPSRHDPELVSAALIRLDDGERDILRLKHGEGLTFDAIAARSGMPTNTVKTRYYRALERLRRRLGGDAPSQEEA